MNLMLGKKGGGGKMKRGIEMCYVHVPFPHNARNHYVL